MGSPPLFGATHIAPVIAELMARHPRLEIELKVGDREVDLVGDRLDMAVRIRELRDSTLKARRLGEVRAVRFARPPTSRGAGGRSIRTSSRTTTASSA